MALSLSKPSRSYDGVRHGVWFWGYDKAREITFFVEDRNEASKDPLIPWPRLEQRSTPC
jgi:hypothetical protein